MAAYEVFAHNATTTVSAGGTDAPSGGTSQSWTVASSSSFPAITNGVSQFHVADPAQPSELVLVTNVSGTTWTVTRGAGSTTPVAHTSGFTVYQVADAGTLGAFAQTGFGDLGGTGAAPAVTGTHLAAALPLAQGGTGQTAQQAAMDALAGAVTSGQHLRGNGTHVVMSAIQLADLPAGTGLQPWQFSVDSATYGAKGDGIVCTVNTNGTTTVVATSSVFTSTAVDGGKYIMIHGGNGTTNAPFVGQISTVTNGTTAVLGSAPSSTINGCPAVFGTDDTAAINAAVTAAGTYATTAGAAAGSGKYYAEVLFGPKVYVLATGPAQTGNGSTTPTFNAQIPLPYPNANGTTQKLIIALTGVKGAGFLQFWQSLIPNVSGTSLVSMTSAPSTPSATFGRQSVIGGPSGSSGFTGSFANVKAVIDGISVWCPIFTNQIAFDLGYLAGMRAVNSGAQIFAPTGVNASAIQPWLQSISAAQFLSSIGVGWRTPVGGNNADVTADDLAAEGYEIGFLVFDHFNAGKLNSIYCDVALKNDGTQGLSGTQHGLFIQSITAEIYNGGFRTNGGSVQVDINWDAEGSGATYDISDTSNTLFGYFRFGDKVDNRAPIVAAGGSNLRILNVNQAPGHMSSPPSVPASTSAATVQYNNAWVTIHTGVGVTVSAVTIDGTATGLTMAASSTQQVRVPAGKTIALTYAGGTPTWDWWLD